MTATGLLGPLRNTHRKPITTVSLFTEQRLSMSGCSKLHPEIYFMVVTTRCSATFGINQIAT